MQLESRSTVTLRTSRQMPILGLGTWKLSNTAEAIKSALGLGYLMIDTSGDYGTQPGIGKGLRESESQREDYYIVTKVEETGDSYVALQNNLDELGLPSVNLTLIHRPPASGVGDDLWQGLIQSQRDGLTADIGVSNYSISQLQKLGDNTGEVQVVNQIEWSPFGHDMAMLVFCRDNGIVIQAYSPLTCGKLLNTPTLDKIGNLHNKTPAQVLIRWDLQLGVVPIVKASSPEHQREDIDVFDFELSDADMTELSNLNEYYSSLGKLSYVRD